MHRYLYVFVLFMLSRNCYCVALFLFTIISFKKSDKNPRTMATKTMFALDPFCLRQFNKPNNPAYISMPHADFMTKLDELCKKQAAEATDNNILFVIKLIFLIKVFIGICLSLIFRDIWNVIYHHHLFFLLCLSFSVSAL